MIEFGVKRASKGKRSRWSKKFPRKRILHRGDEKYCNWYPNNWDEDNYPYFHGNLTKFLISRAIETYLSKSLSNENFQLEQLTSGLKYPKTIVDAVDAKNRTEQEAKKAWNEVEVAKAEAEKLITKAKAERDANNLRTEALTPAVLEKMWIEKWDGTVPTVITGSNTSTFLDLSKIRK